MAKKKKTKGTFLFSPKCEKIKELKEYVHGRHVLVVEGYCYEEDPFRIKLIKMNGFDEVEDIRSLH